ncbi:hypothetical protein Aspvir_006971 [Aspergillus viridinutans]|uniref:Uncharacterized protein n=1 Tax=Aspergillus viridinutans TaxID=75553 RepID=A0A9P3FAM5_ASPVI|nr:uncharacterized protein Aspvir_006971 [Aspergillus viridinutans]GIK07933.1 hypothetical protein Aspvir_006971 [Aspergillus viridinutans]
MTHANLQEQYGKGKAGRTHAEAVNASEEASVSVPPCNDSEKSEAKLVPELNVDYSDIGDENEMFQIPLALVTIPASKPNADDDPDDPGDPDRNGDNERDIDRDIN